MEKYIYGSNNGLWYELQGSITGDNSKIWKCATKRAVKCIVAGAFLPY